MDTTPGVVEPPDTLTHGTDEESENPMLCDTTLDATLTGTGAGLDEVPNVIANEALPEESTRSGEAGRTLRVTPSSPVAGVVAESATVSVNPPSPTTVGVPTI
jgi:hypothetical protein